MDNYGKILPVNIIFQAGIAFGVIGVLAFTVEGYPRNAPAGRE